MGSNNLTYVSGGTILITHPNQYYTALNQDFLPRNSSGVVTTIAGSLGTSTYKWLDAFISGTINIGTTANGNKIYESGTDLRFQTASTDRLTIETNGEIGIGTSDPQSLLHVLSGGTAQAGSADSDELVLQNSSTGAQTAGLTIISGATGSSIVSFGDTSDSNAGQLWYDHSSDTFKIITTTSTENTRFYWRNTDGDEAGFYLSYLGASFNYRIYDAGTAGSYTGTLVSYSNSGLSWNFGAAGNTGTDKFDFSADDAGAGDIQFLIRNDDSTVSTTHTLLKLAYPNEDIDSLGGVSSLNVYALFTDSTGTLGSIGYNPSTNLVTFNTTSDARLKTDLQDFNGLDMVNSLGVYNFAWKKNNKRAYGFMAQEYYEKIHGEKIAEDYPDTLNLDYGKMTPYLWKAVQELSKRVEELEKH